MKNNLDPTFFILELEFSLGLELVPSAMPKMKFLNTSEVLVILALTCSLSKFVFGQPKPILVQVLFRHGMRAPEHPYPSDPYTDEYKYWPNGWGQLTNYGKEQQYVLGQFLRARYNSLLSPSYSSKELLVTSSDYDRTIMTVLLVLAGLYPKRQNNAPGGYTYDALPWEPIPVHTIGSGQNRLMLHPSYISIESVCPRYYRLLNHDIKQSPEYLAIESQHKDLIDFVRNATGAGPDKSFMNLFGGYMMTLKIERFYNLSIPPWAIEILDNPSKLEIAGRVFGFLTHTHEMKRLLAGPMLVEWMGNMKNKLAGNESRSMFMYSAHDLNLVHILNTLELFESPYVPEMGSGILLELFDGKDGGGDAKPYVKLFYRDGTSMEVKELRIPSCGASLCTLDEFQAKISDFLVEDLDKECSSGISSWSSSSSSSLSVLDGILIALATLLLILLIISQFYSYKQRQSKDYCLDNK